MQGIIHNNINSITNSKKRPFDSSSSRGQNYKRHRWSGRNQTTLETVVDFIFNLPSLHNIEIEFKVGRIQHKANNKSFESFLNKEDFDAIYSYIKKVTKYSNCTDYIYNTDCRFNTSRITTNDDDHIVGATYRETLRSFDMATNHNHDIRISIAREIPIVPLPEAIADNFDKKRKRVRFTISNKDSHITLTDVLVDDETQTYELEASVRLSSIIEAADKAACVSLLDNIFVEVHNLLARLQENGAQVFPDLKLERVTRHDHREYLKSQFMPLVPNMKPGQDSKFPGSLPKGVERAKLPNIQNGKYWVSEKSDGLRYMMFFTERNVYLVDRRMDFYQIHKFPYIIDLFATKGVTLLDGEMVRNLKTGKLMFLIFDILAVNGKTNLGMHRLTDRLAIIGSQVINPFRANLKEDPLKLQFTLIGKIFRPKHLIGELASMIKHNDKGERLFVDDKRCHRNDGLIFTPDGPYLPFSSSHLFKWKYGDRLTIDFRFRFGAAGHLATVGVDGGEAEWKTFDMPPSDWDKLTTELGKTKNPTEAIIECAFDAAIQKWKFLTLRPDKDRPNFITTVEHTLSIVNEDITIEELVYRIPRLPAKDEWEKLHPEKFIKKEEENENNSEEEQEGEPSLDSYDDDDHDDSPSSHVDLPTSPVPSPLVYKSPSIDSYNENTSPYARTPASSSEGEERENDDDGDGDDDDDGSQSTPDLASSLDPENSTPPSSLSSSSSSILVNPFSMCSTTRVTDSPPPLDFDIIAD